MRVCCCVLAEVGKNDKYVGHFPELWFSGVKHSELVRGEKEQRGQLKEKRRERERNHKESDRRRRGGGRTDRNVSTHNL